MQYSKITIVTGGINKSEIPMIAAKYNIGDFLTRKTMDGNSVRCKIVKKFKDFCMVENIGKKECVLWTELA